MPDCRWEGRCGCVHVDAALLKADQKLLGGEGVKQVFNGEGKDEEHGYCRVNNPQATKLNPGASLYGTVHRAHQR